MRQLAARGWIHNRARLIVASFLTKDLHIDWRRGEAHFMRLLADGDEGSNNGNWQWITSIGVDPAPYFRRMYNPATQQERHDPDGAYVRRWVPELRDVPLERLAEPWTMTDEQEAAGCVIGRDYPEPIVDHKQERERAMARYRAVRGGYGAWAARDAGLPPGEPARGRPPLAAHGRAHAARRPEENYWFRRHLVVYEWIAARAHGRRVVDLACGRATARPCSAAPPPRSSASTPTPRRSSTRG